MRILFLGYWGIQDELTISTVFPHLRLLQERPDVTAIRLVTIERGLSEQDELAFVPGFEINKISFVPLRSRPKRNVIFNKVEDFIRFPIELVKQVAEFKPDFILARGAPAGALAYLVWQKIRLPFYVESFEPHADYMLESGIWRRYDPRYLFQRYWEKRQKQLARGLMPVAENYRHQLIQEGVAAKYIATVPCSVDAVAFAFNHAARQRVRHLVGFDDPATVIGIYVGKFGGIYYDREAFTVFRAAADYFGHAFRLLILTPDHVADVQQRLAEAGLPTTHAYIVKAPHNEVPDYLSAADFAFATIKPADCRLYCSAIKIGEYWASGLPVLLPPGIGDDSAIVEMEGGGAVFDLDYPATLPKALKKLDSIWRAPNSRAQVRKLALQHRSLDQARQAYTMLLPKASASAL